MCLDLALFGGQTESLIIADLFIVGELSLRGRGCVLACD